MIKMMVPRILLAATAAAAGLVSASPVASAAWSDCGNNACAWAGINGTGGLLKQQYSGWSNFGAGDNDETSSIRNGKSSVDVAFYTSANLSGSRFCLNPNYQAGYVGDGWNDEISSVVVYSGNSYC